MLSLYIIDLILPLICLFECMSDSHIVLTDFIKCYYRLELASTTPQKNPLGFDTIFAPSKCCMGWLVWTFVAELRVELIMDWHWALRLDSLLLRPLIFVAPLDVIAGSFSTTRRFLR
jgi:hypothetical protein